MKKLLLVLTALAASSAHAQEAAKPPSVLRIVEVKHTDPGRLARLLKIFGIHVEADHQLKIISLSGDAESVKVAEDAIRRLDVPSKARNVESTFYMLMASQKGESGKLPAEVDGVIKQLKAVSAYQSYRLLDTIVLRTRENMYSETSGSLPAPSAVQGRPQTGTYNLRITSVTVDPEPKGGNVVHLNDLRFMAKMPVLTGPTQWQFNENHISTSVDVREGQKVVIGKSNVDGSDNALILVVMVKVIE